MEIIRYPEKDEWPDLCRRPDFDADDIEQAVNDIMERVRKEGDQALIALNKEIDGYDGPLAVSETEWDAGASQVAEELKQAIAVAADNIRQFHELQQEPVRVVETMKGVSCWRKSVAVDAVGLYIPGGSAPLFSTVLMLAIPAELAGCPRRVLVTPPSADGTIDPAILYSAKAAGVTEIYRAGGAQAIAALGFGTETIGRVNKIFGPGNRYVTLAKQKLAARGIAIDMPAGPSEVLIVADAEANPTYIAADLLAQAEHGPDSQVLLVSDSEKLLREAQKEVAAQLARLPRKAIAEKALQNSRFVLLRDLEEAMLFSNYYAPEHLILNAHNAEELAMGVVNAGSVFVGALTPEAAGDYASGTNHTLPTNGSAVAFSGVSLDSFYKKITFQKISDIGLKRLGPPVETMAQAEQLQGHKNSVSVRLRNLKGAR